MNISIHIVFFIVLSFALHLLLLPFDFMPQAMSSTSGVVDVAYISRSLDGFYPRSAPQRKTSQTATALPEKMPVVDRTSSQEPLDDPAVVVKQSKTTPLKPEAKPDYQRSETTIKDVENPLPEIVADKTVAIDPTKEELTEADVEISLDPHPSEPLPEPVSEPLLQHAVISASPPALDSMSSTGKPAQDQLSISNRNSSAGSASVDNNTRQGFKDALPHYDDNPPPRYPDVAKLRGWEGKVVLKAAILKSGRVGRLQVVASSGYRSLDSAARKAISRWTFSPATTFGVPVDSMVEIPVSFSLKDL